MCIIFPSIAYADVTTFRSLNNQLSTYHCLSITKNKSEKAIKASRAGSKSYFILQVPIRSISNLITAIEMLMHENNMDELSLPAEAPTLSKKAARKVHRERQSMRTRVNEINREEAGVQDGQKQDDDEKDGDDGDNGDNGEATPPDSGEDESEEEERRSVESNSNSDYEDEEMSSVHSDDDSAASEDETDNRRAHESGSDGEYVPSEYSEAESEPNSNEDESMDED